MACFQQGATCCPLLYKFTLQTESHIQEPESRHRLPEFTTKQEDRLKRILQVWLQKYYKCEDRLQQYMNHELPDVQAGFRKGRRIRDQTANICWILKEARELKKKSTSALLTTPKPLTVWITINHGKLLKRWEYQATLPAPEKSVCRSRSNSY